MKNRYGLDVSYLEGKLLQLIADIDNYKPDEAARVLLRLSVVCDSEVISEKEFDNYRRMNGKGD